MLDYYLDGNAVIVVEYDWAIDDGRKAMFKVAGSEYIIQKCRTEKEAEECLRLLKGGGRVE